MFVKNKNIFKKRVHKKVLEIFKNEIKREPWETGQFIYNTFIYPHCNALKYLLLFHFIKKDEFQGDSYCLLVTVTVPF